MNRVTKYLITALLISLPEIFLGQQIFTFKITKTVIRIKELDKSWGEWKELGNMNKDTKRKLTVDLLSKTMESEMIFDNEKNLFQYDIIGVDGDYQYKDFGIWVMWIKAKAKTDNSIYNYKIAFKEQNKCIMLYEKGDIQSKDEMELITE